MIAKKKLKTFKEETTFIIDGQDGYIHKAVLKYRIIKWIQLLREKQNNTGAFCLNCQKETKQHRYVGEENCYKKGHFILEDKDLWENHETSDMTGTIFFLMYFFDIKKEELI